MQMFFCIKNNIDKIDLLKLDTEGSEYEVLLGGRKMLLNNKIKTIFFEFNEMNVFSRVFFRDFYKLLKNYKIYPRKFILLIQINQVDFKKNSSHLI